jgi:hypothetical protein
MTKTAPRSTKTEASLLLSDLATHAQGWILDGEIRQLSRRTIEARRFLVEKLLWFLHQRECEACGTAEIRAFLFLAPARERGSSPLSCLLVGEGAGSRLPHVPQQAGWP